MIVIRTGSWVSRNLSVSSRLFMIANKPTGSCGVLQCASKPIQFVASQVDFILKSMNIDISHNLANTFYINAFDNKFVANNCYNCVGTVSASSLPTGFRMGYVENRRKYENLFWDWNHFNYFSHSQLLNHRKNRKCNGQHFSFQWKRLLSIDSILLKNEIWKIKILFDH